MKKAFSFVRVLQIGIVVKNVEVSAKRYADEYGIGPWKFYDLNSSSVSEMKIKGKPRTFAMRIALADLQGIELELIEPKDNQSIYAQFLTEKGEGLHHLAFATADYDQAMAYFAEKGLQVLQTGTWQNETFTYIDTRHDLSFILEIYKRVGSFESPPPIKIYPEITQTEYPTMP